MAVAKFTTLLSHLLRTVNRASLAIVRALRALPRRPSPLRLDALEHVGDLADSMHIEVCARK
jgi:hypothetical protein